MRIFLMGATGQARLCHLVLTERGHTIPFVYDRTVGLEAPFETMLFTDESKILDYAKQCDGFLVTIAGSHGEPRARYSRMLLDAGLEPISCVHPTTYIGETVKCGLGLQTLPHVVVNEFAEIGDWCVLSTNCTVDHESKIGNGVHVMGGAAIAGLVIVEDYATIGTNATILPRLTIGRGAFVGAGAVVTKDVTAGTVVVGAPARQLVRP